jgi:hypothetical protein
MQRVLAGLVIVVVLALVTMVRWGPDLLLYLFYLRVPLIVAGLLLALHFVGTRVAPGMLRNLFAYDNALDLGVVSAFSVLSSVALGVSAYTVVTAAPLRYGVPTLASPTVGLWILALSLAIIVAATVVTCWVESHELSSGRKARAVVLGILVAAAATALAYWLLAVSPLERAMLDLLEKSGAAFGESARAGYVAADGTMVPGHVAATAFLAVVLVFYAISYHLFKPTARITSWKPPALFFLFQVVIFLCTFLSGACFFFDLFRFPTLVASLALSAGFFVLAGTDHFFKITDAPDAGIARDEDEQVASLRAALEARLKDQPEDDRTLVVICASGGGIQAAAWTTRVLTRLQARYGEKFARAVGLISSASGGSVGTLHYLDRFDVERGCPPADELEAVFEQATHNSLSATAWGLSGPDFLKAAFLPWIAPKRRDRGWAIEEQWRKTLKHDGASFADWGKHVLAGEMPCPVFNGTVVETGDRLLLAPLAMKHAIEARETEDFYSLYGDKDLDVVTAARLSATFPYVTPVCRPDPAAQPAAGYHVADGGYFDNFGVSTAAQWIDKVVLNAPRQLGIKRIQVLEINAFPEDSADSDMQSSGWWYSVAGPLVALLKVRTSTQTSRNDTELEFLRRVCWGKVRVDRIRFRFALESGGKAQAAFRGREGTYQPPLSWKLTKTEKAAIDQGWSHLEDEGSSLIDLDRVWL